MQNRLHKIRLAIGLFFGLILLGYGAYETRDALRGPDITITSPYEGQTVTSSLITVSGSARNIARMSLNGRQIYTNEHGNFTEELLVPEGYSILELKATDIFSREIRKLIRITRKDA